MPGVSGFDGTVGKPVCSGIQVWDELAFDTHNHVFQPQFLLLQPLQSDHIGIRIGRQLMDSNVQVAMRNSEFF